MVKLQPGPHEFVSRAVPGWPLIMTLDVVNDNDPIPPEPDPGRDGPIVMLWDFYSLVTSPQIMHNLSAELYLYR